MENTISNSIMPQFRTTYQDLPATEKARIEKDAVENTTPYQYTQPAMPTRPSPPAPGSSASSISSSKEATVINETPVRNDDIKPSWASRLGAKLLLAGANTLSFLQKVVNAIVSAAKAFATKVSNDSKAVAGKVSNGLKAVAGKIGAGAKTAQAYAAKLTTVSKSTATTDAQASVDAEAVEKN